MVSDIIKEDHIEEKSFHKKRRRYIQKYSSSWEHHELYSGWLKKSSFGIHHAYCSVCDIDLSLKAGVTDLRKHARSKKHMKHFQLYSGTPNPLKLNSANGTTNSSYLTYVTKLESPLLETSDLESDAKSPTVKISIEESSFHVDEASISHVSPEHSSQKLPRRSKNGSAAVCEDYDMLVSSSLSEDISFNEDEFESFGKFVSNQLRKFPEKMAVELTLDIHDLIAKRRLQAIKEQSSSQNIPDSQVITFSLPKVYSSNFATIQHANVQ